MQSRRVSGYLGICRNLGMLHEQDIWDIKIIDQVLDVVVPPTWSPPITIPVSSSSTTFPTSERGVTHLIRSLVCCFISYFLIYLFISYMD